MRRLRRDGLLVLLVVFALAEITEGGVDTWGVLFLRNHLATGSCSGRAPTWSASRWRPRPGAPAGRVLGRLSARRALIIGGCVAGAGILLESLSPFSGWPPSAWPSGPAGRRCSGPW